MTCDNIRDFFAEALYGELDARRKAEFDHHLGSCDSCRKEFEGLKDTLALMNRRTCVEPTEKEWTEFSKRLDEKLSTEIPGTMRESRDDRSAVSEPSPAHEIRPAIHPILPFLPAFRPAWAYGIAAVLLVAFGIYMGRTFFGGNGINETPGGDRATVTSVPPSDTGDQPTNPVETGAADEIAQSVPPDPETKTTPAPRTRKQTNPVDQTNDDALVYLERSRNLLIGLTNLDAKQSAAIDLSHQVQVSRRLYNQGNVLAVALNRPSQQQLRQLVQNLQIILLQLTNMEVGTGTPAIELVRQGVDSKSILLKINLEAIRATLSEARADAPASTGGTIRKNL